ncbi:MAG: pitrilysin family protein [Actinomycetota bacterium]|nr:pitrilysin family protein [Actinomycetota bacterium]
MSKPIVERTVFPCGIKVVSEEIPSANSISLSALINTGSRDENKNEAGFSHFLEHMVFKGTPRFSAKEIVWEFDNMGADINAVTGREYTSFFTRTLEENLSKALEILFDMVKTPLLDERDLQSEKQVVLEEIAMHLDSPDELALEYLTKAIWKDHPAGNDILGDVKLIKNMKRNDLERFHVKSYVSERMLVCAAGRVTHELLSEHVEKQISGIKSGDPPDRSNLPEYSSSKIILKKDTEQANICIGSPGLPTGHPDRFALVLADNILGGSMSSRLFQKIREEKALAYSIYSFSTMLIGAGMVGIYCGTHPENTKQVVKLIENELIRIAEDGFDREELIRAKNHIKGSLLISMEDIGNRMNKIAKAELSETEIMSVDEILENIMSVTLEDVSRVYSSTWGSGKRALAVVGPFGEQDISL